MKLHHDSSIEAPAPRYAWDDADYRIAWHVQAQRKEINLARGRTARPHQGRDSDSAHTYGYLGEMAVHQFLRDCGLVEGNDFKRARPVIAEARDADEDVTILGEDVDVKSAITPNRETCEQFLARTRHEGFRINAKTNRTVRPHPPYYCMVVADPTQKEIWVLGFVSRDTLLSIPTQRMAAGFDNHFVPPTAWEPPARFLQRVQKKHTDG